MIVKAQGKFLRISPNKVRRVINLLRGQDVFLAKSILNHTNSRPKEFLNKILNAAIANAKTKGVSADKLYVSKIVCDNGPSWKRYRAAAFGRAAQIKKRTSHIRIELDLKT